MDGFRNIAITNFRGIDHLEIGDFSRVNVFLGHNSSGKSTVLDERPENREDMRIYLANTFSKGHQAYRYTNEGLSGACENDIELRTLNCNNNKLKACL